MPGGIGFSGNTVASAWVELGVQDKLSQGLVAPMAALGKFSAKVLGVSTAIGAMVVAVKKSVDAFIDYDKQLHNVWTLLGETREQVEAEGQSIRNLARDYNVSSTEAVKAIYMIHSATFYGANAMNILKTAIRGAAAGLSDVIPTAKMLTAVLNAYGMSASQAEHINDLLFTTIRYGVTTMPELASQFGRLAGIAAPAGASVEDMTAAIATLTRQGIQTDWAITALRQTIMQFIKPTKNLKDAIHGLGFESGSTLIKTYGFAGALRKVTQWAKENGVAMDQMFTNVRAVTAVLPLATTSAAAYAKDQERMANATGQANLAFRKQTESWAYQIAKFKTLVGDLAISFGKIFMPAIKELISVLELLVNAIRPAIELFDKLGGGYLIAIVGTITGLTTALWLMVKAWKAVTTWAAAATAATTAASASMASAAGAWVTTATTLSQGATIGAVGGAAAGAGGIAGLLARMGGGSVLKGLGLAGLGAAGLAMTAKAIVNLDLKPGTISGAGEVKRSIVDTINSALGPIIAGAVIGNLFAPGIGAAIGAAAGATFSLIINVIHEIKPAPISAELKTKTEEYIRSTGVTFNLPETLKGPGGLMAYAKTLVDLNADLAGNQAAYKIAYEYLKQFYEFPSIFQRFFDPLKSWDWTLKKVSPEMQGLSDALTGLAAATKAAKESVKAATPSGGLPISGFSISGATPTPSGPSFAVPPAPGPSLTLPQTLATDWAKAQAKWKDLTEALKNGGLTADEVDEKWQELTDMQKKWSERASIATKMGYDEAAAMTMTTASWKDWLDLQPTVTVAQQQANSFFENAKSWVDAFAAAKEGSLAWLIAQDQLNSIMADAAAKAKEFTDQNKPIPDDLEHLIVQLQKLGIVLKDVPDVAQQAAQSFTDNADKWIDAFKNAQEGSLEWLFAQEQLNSIMADAAAKAQEFSDQGQPIPDDLQAIIDQLIELGITLDTTKSAAEIFNAAIADVSTTLGSVAGQIGAAFGNLEQAILSTTKLGEQMTDVSALLSGAANIKTFRENLEKIITGTGFSQALVEQAKRLWAGLKGAEPTPGKTFAEVQREVDEKAKKAAQERLSAMREAASTAKEVAQKAKEAADKAISNMQEAFNQMFKLPALGALETGQWKQAAEAVVGLAQHRASIQELARRMSDLSGKTLDATEIMSLIKQAGSGLLSALQDEIDLARLAGENTADLERFQIAVKDIVDPLRRFKKELIDLIVANPAQAAQEVHKQVNEILARYHFGEPTKVPSHQAGGIVNDAGFVYVHPGETILPADTLPLPSSASYEDIANAIAEKIPQEPQFTPFPTPQEQVVSSAVKIQANTNLSAAASAISSAASTAASAISGLTGAIDGLGKTASSATAIISGYPPSAGKPPLSQIAALGPSASYEDIKKIILAAAPQGPRYVSFPSPEVEAAEKAIQEAARSITAAAGQAPGAGEVGPPTTPSKEALAEIAKTCKEIAKLRAEIAKAEAEAQKSKETEEAANKIRKQIPASLEELREKFKASGVDIDKAGTDVASMFEELNKVAQERRDTLSAIQQAISDFDLLGYAKQAEDLQRVYDDYIAELKHIPLSLAHFRESLDKYGDDIQSIIDQLFPGVQKLTDSVYDLIKSTVNLNFYHLQEASSDLGKSFEILKQAGAALLSGSLGKTGGLTRGAARAALAAAGEFVKAGGLKVINAILTVIKVIVDYAKEAMDYVNTRVKEFGNAVSDLASKKFAELKDKIDQLIGSLKGLIESTDAYQRLQSAWSKIQSGVFNLLLGFLYPIVALLEKFAGLLGETNKQMSSLNIPSGYKVTREEWRAATPGQPAVQTGAGALPAWVSDLLRKFTKPISEIIAKFKAFIKILSDVGSKIGEAIFPSVLEAFSSFVDQLSELAGHIQKDLLPIFVKYLPDVIKGALDFFSGEIVGFATFFVDTLAGILPNLAAFGDNLGAIGGQLPDLAESLSKAVVPAINSLLEDALIPLSSFISDTLIPDLEGFLDGFGKWWQSDVDPFLKSEVFPTLGEWLSAVYDWIKEELMPFLEKNLMPEIEGLWKDTIKPALEGLGDALNTLWSVIKDNMPTINALLEEFINDKLNELMGTIDTVSAYLQTKSGDLMGGLETIWNSKSLDLWDKLKISFGLGATAVWDWIKEASKPLIDAFGNLFKAIGPVLIPALQTVAGILGGALLIAINGLAAGLNILSSAVNAVTSVFKAIGNFIIDVINGIIRIINLLPFVNIPLIPHLQQGGKILSEGLVYAHKNEFILPATTVPLATAGGGIIIDNTITLDGHVLYHSMKRINQQEERRRTGSSIGGRAWRIG